MAGLRERKKAQTRAALARAAAEIARFEGPEKQNIGAISERADVSPRTFHNYFSSREDALREFTVLTVTELLDGLEPAPSVHDAVEAAVIRGVRRGDDELTSFYSLSVLTQEITPGATALPSAEDRDLHVKVLARFHEVFPDVSIFDLASQLASAAMVAQFALTFYFSYEHHNGVEAGENIVRRAFDQFRESPLGSPVATPLELQQEIERA